MSILPTEESNGKNILWIIIIEKVYSSGEEDNTQGESGSIYRGVSEQSREEIIGKDQKSEDRKIE